MQRLIAAAALMSLSSLALAEPSIDCSGLSAPQVIQSATAVAPVAGELGTPEQPLGVAGGVLDQPATDALSAEQVLYRQQLERCAQVATATAPAVPGVVPAADAMPAAPVAEGMVASTMPAATPAPEVIDAATYKPRTEFDNTPWRFNMNQNGERMTADAFAAWMEAKGVRVAKGRAPAAVPAEAEAAAQAPEGAADAPREQGDDE
ncbi:hypothetical protein [Novilysobacter defluvii]|uniref:Uncharacterized protein n=1 Tax=Lysobacter defluvii IMMIB APB-9 = DSM 18482 TaxID=1385515 RepID=A0A0A0M960_9GAMM|nr:hypothetical protein [Lysobacter defluvii]KGO98789.1 hypothetical protein N791_01010 [Lysobacter defluvii IMMIB APB-9 = DSM 18482]